MNKIQKPKPLVPIKMDLHKGMAAKNLADAYSDPYDAVREIIQNSIDAEAKNIHIILNSVNRQLKVIDNGIGESYEQLSQKWGKIGVSFKAEDPEKYGKKGIGNLAGIAIAEHYEVTTRPTFIKGSHYFRAHLKSKDLELDQPELPAEEFPLGFGLPKTAFGSVITQVILSKMSKSVVVQLSNIEELADVIADAFSVKISSRGIKILIVNKTPLGDKSIQVRPKEFIGRRNDPHTIRIFDKSVVFEMYTTLQPIKSPHLIILHSRNSPPTPVYLQNLKDIWNRVKDSLGSGYIEGNIYVEGFCELTADRRHFKMDREYDMLCEAILQYDEDCAKVYLEEMKGQALINRYTEMFRTSSDTMDRYLRNNPELQLQLSSHLTGFVSRGHYEAEKAPVTPEKFRQTPKEKPPTITEVKKRRELRKEGEKKQPEQEHKKYQHTKVKDPEGYLQRQVKGQFGVTISWDSPKSEGSRWMTRMENGVIVFNVEHNNWIKAKDKSKSKATLQNYINLHILKEVAAVGMDETRKKHFIEGIDNLLMKYWWAYE